MSPVFPRSYASLVGANAIRSRDTIGAQSAARTRNPTFATGTALARYRAIPARASGTACPTLASTALVDKGALCISGSHTKSGMYRLSLGDVRSQRWLSYTDGDDESCHSQDFIH